MNFTFQKINNFVNRLSLFLKFHWLISQFLIVIEFELQHYDRFELIQKFEKNEFLLFRKNLHTITRWLYNTIVQKFHSKLVNHNFVFIAKIKTFETFHYRNNNQKSINKMYRKFFYRQFIKSESIHNSLAILSIFFICFKNSIKKYTIFSSFFNRFLNIQKFVHKSQNIATIAINFEIDSLSQSSNAKMSSNIDKFKIMLINQKKRKKLQFTNRFDNKIREL